MGYCGGTLKDPTYHHLGDHSETVQVDFDTDNPGKWITHCHNTYHLEGGMGGWIFYES